MAQNWNGGDGELELRDYLGVLWRRKKFVFLSVFLLVATALGLSYAQTPVYRATSQFELPAVTAALASAPGGGKGASEVATAMVQIKSEEIAQKVKAVLGPTPSPTAENLPATNLIDVTVESTDAALAARAADLYPTEFLEQRKQAALKQVNDTLGPVVPRHEGALARENAINLQIANALPFQQDALRLRFSVELTQLRRTINDDGVTLSELLPRRAAIESHIPKDSVTPAKVPKKPVRPTPVRNAGLAIPVGLIIGVALAFMFEHLDDTLKSKEDVERVTAPLPVVGVIPQVRMRDDGGSELVALAAPDSPVVEAYRSLRTSVQFLALDGALGSIQVTSSSAAEGKTTTLANLAVVMARAGAKVVVIDCDLRRPRIHEIFGVPNEIGFTSVFQGQVPLSSALQAIPGERNLRVLPSGPLPPNPSELLASRRTAGILASLKAQGVVVLLDCPPVIAVTDAAALSAWVDTTIVVAAQGTTTTKQLHRSVELLRQVNAPLVGTVLNRAQGQEGYGYGYYYRRPEAAPKRPSGQRSAG